MFVGAKDFDVLFANHPGEEATPVWGQLQPGSNPYQRVRPDLHLMSPAPFTHKFPVSLVIVVTKERPLPAVSPLGDVVGHSRCDNTRQSGHDERLSLSSPVVNNSVWCPRNP